MTSNSPSQKTPEASRSELMRQLAVVRRDLSAYGIRDAADYAEALVAEAIGGDRHASGVNKGHDVVSQRFGRVEVKCRQLPADGRLEERVSVSAAKEGGFDHLAVVIFHADFEIKGAVIIPYGSVWADVAAQKYNRISYRQACELEGAMDITAGVKAASCR